MAVFLALLCFGTDR